METRKLFYEDCHLAEFTARVMACTKTEKGYEIILNATAFYPEGGGQACDLGKLGSVNVLDVRERGEQIIHLCDGPVAVGETVEGAIDYARRFDLMQQHTGEHVVSGVIHRRFGYQNVGFHVGSDVVTIDFDGMLTPEELAEVEAEANAVLWQNLAVKCWYPNREELPDVKYRSKRELPWPVRIVQVPDTDSCACCGVHVAYTGEVGLIKLLNCVKFHQGVRIEMACGGRAMEILNRVYDQNRQVSQAFSAKILETGEAARRINDQLAKEKFRAAQLQKQVFAGIADSYVNRESVIHFDPQLEPGQVRELADAIAAKISGVAGVFSGSDEAGYNGCFIGPVDAVKALGAAVKPFGKGGGKPGSWQGRLAATEEQIRGLLETAL